MADDLKGNPDWKKSTRDEIARGVTQIGIACIDKHVVMKFPQKMEYIAMKAENARFIAEAIGRAAYEAHYGKAAPDDMRSALLHDVREKLTDEMRDKMIARFSMVMPSMLEQLRGAKTPGRIAMELVDMFMVEVTQR